MQPSVLILIRGHVSLKPSILLANLLRGLGSKGEKRSSALFGESQNSKKLSHGPQTTMPKLSWKMSDFPGNLGKGRTSDSSFAQGSAWVAVASTKGCTCAYFHLCQRAEKAKRKPAKCQEGTRKGAGEMQREAREHTERAGVAPGRLGLGLKAVAAYLVLRCSGKRDFTYFPD